MSIDFIPSNELKELQKTELCLLQELKRVCTKYGLTYYASGGTLLGAARHKGFIPWDDDIDVQMMWDDFKILMEVAPREFQYPFFFQNYKNDTFGELSNAKLRKSDTSGCTKWEYDNIKDPAHNRGIFIDIFPMFAIPASEEIREKQKKDIIDAWQAFRGWNAIQTINAGHPSEYEKYIPFFDEMSRYYTIEQIKQKYMDACAYSDDESEEIGETSFKTHNEKFIWKRSWFSETVELPFEDTTITCPKYYDEVLTKQYGEWQVPVYNAALHEMYIFDTKTPYSQRQDLF